MVLIVAMVVAGHFNPGLNNSRVEDGIRNSMYVIVFATLALVLFEACKVLGVIKAAVIVVGGLSELLQSTSSRQPDMRDFARDGGGALLALAGRLMWHFSAYKTAGGRETYCAR
jgi:hypothetical protein